MALKLCAPVIGGMVSNLSTAVFVSNCSPGNVIVIRSLTRPGQALVKKQIGATDGYLTLEPGEALLAGDLLVASQQDAAGTASVETDPKLAVAVGEAPSSSADIAPVDIAGRLWECGKHAYVGGASPGLTVEILRNGAVIGSAAAPDGVARMALTRKLVAWETVIVRQRNGAAIGAELRREVEGLPVPPGTPLPPPRVVSPVRACKSSVHIEGVFEGADVTVSRKSGESQTAGFDLSGLWFNLATPLSEANGWLKVKQTMPGCERDGQETSYDIDRPERPGTPYVYPLCAGMATVFVDNVDTGAELRIKAGADEYVTSASGNGMNRFDVNPLAPGFITVQAFACGLASELVTVPVDTAPAQIDTPVISGELVKCQRSVPVAGLKPGAIVQVFSKGPRLGETAISAQRVVTATRMDIPVIALIEDAQVWAVQWACNLMQVRSEPKQVKPAPVVDDPFFADVVTRIATSVQVKKTIRDARVEILRRGENERWLLIGAATAPGPNTLVPLTVTLAVGDVLKLRQRYCAVQSPGAQQTTVVKPVPLAPKILSPTANETIGTGTAVALLWTDPANGPDADRKAESFDLRVTRGGTPVLTLSQPGTSATLPASATAVFNTSFQFTVTPRNATGQGPATRVSFRTPKAADPKITAVQDGEKIKVTGSGFAVSRQVEIEIVTDYSVLVGAPSGSPGTVQVNDFRRGKELVVSDASGNFDVSLVAANVLEPRQETTGASYKAKPYPGATVRVTARNKQPMAANLGSSSPSNTVSLTWSA
jgi:hypothetical protein